MAVRNTIEGHEGADGGSQQSAAQRQSTITCPACRHQQAEIMPIDACLFFYECTACKRMLRPRAGDCCVFCSYGTARCPSMS
ncbi:MAG: GDCCVxC domain-containing (seleno)protein [Chloroflexaceae bacterium]